MDRSGWLNRLIYHLQRRDTGRRCVKLSKYNKQLLILVNCNSSIIQNVFNEQLGCCNLIQSDLEVSQGIKQRYPTLFVKYLEKCKVTTPVASVGMQRVEWFEFRKLQFNFDFPSMESIFGMRNRFLLCQLQNFFDQLMIYSFDRKFLIFFFFFLIPLELLHRVELQIKMKYMENFTKHSINLSLMMEKINIKILCKFDKL